MPSASVYQAVAVFCGTWLLWKIFHRFIVRSPLDNIPGPPSNSFMIGNLAQLLTLDSWGVHESLIENYPGVARLQGPFGSRMLYIFDPSAMHNILVKDQHIFEETRFFLKTNRFIFGEGLPATVGEHHRKQRKLLNPVFSTKHLRSMMPIVYRVGNALVEAIESRVCAGTPEIDVLEWMSRVSLELIGQAGLGYSFDPLVRDKADEYADAVKSFNTLNASCAIIRRALPYLPTIRFLGIGHKLLEMFPHEGVRKLVKVSDTFQERSTAILEEKKRALQEGDEAIARQVGEGKDIISILLRANIEASEEDKLPESEIVAQMSVIIMAAMDTTSNALSLILSRLAQNPDAQQKLREELIQAGAADGEIDFDTLMTLPYLEAVCRETLRCDTPAPQVFREAREAAILPLLEPIKGIDGKMIHEIMVPKDTTLVVSLLNCNRNKAIWGEDAFEWKPERFLSPLPSTVADAKIPGVYSNIMSFLGGGRSCIGFKFSQLEMKVVLALLLPKFTFETTDKTVFWNSAAIRYPSVGARGGKASLPMKVGLVGGVA